MKKNVYVIIPAFNEQKHIREVVLSVIRYCPQIIVVDDGSVDKTNSIAKDLPITLITLPINVGKGYAMRVGVDHAFFIGADAVITFDSDGQHNAAHIPKFISAIQDHDVVIGVRKGHHQIPFIRKFGNRLASILIYWLYGIYVEDLLCGFRAISKSAYPKLRWSSQKYGVETEMIAKIGISKLKFKQIEIENIYLDQFKGVTLLDAIEVFISIPKFKLRNP